jgi:hypothetical protein
VKSSGRPQSCIARCITLKTAVSVGEKLFVDFVAGDCMCAPHLYGGVPQHRTTPRSVIY